MNHSNAIVPPRWPLKLLQFLLKDSYLEEIEGDMEEVFQDNVQKYSIQKARRLYLWETLRLFRPVLLKNSVNTTKTPQLAMFRNYMKVAWRNLFKHKGFSSINITSLSIGIAACIVIHLFITDEQSFDSLHTKGDNIYRLCEVQSFTGTNTQNVALSMPIMGPTLVEDFPSIERYARFWGWGQRLLEVGDQRFQVDKTVAVDSTFLDMFDFPLIAGDRKTVLSEPNTIVITEEVALRFFNKTDVVGETITRNGSSYEITGVLEDIPENSHLQFDVLISLVTIKNDRPDFNSEMGSNFLTTYLELNPNSNIDELTAQFPDYLRRQAENDEVTDYYQLFLQPLSEVHLGSMDIEHDYHNYRKFNGTYIDIFVLVGIFILIIASVNFMNLTAARANTRSKEVGVRKSIGARKRQLLYQFILESVIMSVLALVIALLIDMVTLPFLNDLISRELTLTTVLWNPSLLIIIVAATLILGLITGLYPSLYLSSFNVVRVLKGAESAHGKSFFRSSLVIIQFSLALAMIVSTFVVVQQLFYIKNKDIGFDKEHIVLVEMSEESNEKYEAIKQELTSLPGVLGVTASGQRLGNNFHQWGFKARVDTGMLQITPSNVLVDYDYLDVYGIELVEGRSFSKDHAMDDGLSFVINESFARELGYENPIGQRVGHSWYPDDSLGTIIGVTEDFNFNSLHYEVNTLSMVVHTEWGFSEMSIKLDGKNIQSGILGIEQIWLDNVTDYPFKHQFLDEHFNELYKSDEQMGSVITIMAILAILIGCMGLFGLAAISIERRIKEIGIRKVLGASTQQLLVLLSKQFVVLLLVSFVVASPLTYLYLNGWLENFAFRVSINPLIFLLGGIVSFVIAMATISFHTFRASQANPVDSLRYE